MIVYLLLLSSHFVNAAWRDKILPKEWLHSELLANATDDQLALLGGIPDSIGLYAVESPHKHLKRSLYTLNQMEAEVHLLTNTGKFFFFNLIIFFC